MKKIFKWALISISGFFLLAFIAGYVIITQINFNQYKEKIITLVKNETNRELKIGDIQVKVSFRPVIEIKNVTFANAQWGRNPFMVSADEIYLGFNILPLLTGSYEISNFAVKNMTLNLEENSGGDTNWNFTKKVELPQKKSYSFHLIREASAEEIQNNVSSLLSAFVIKKVKLENVNLNYTDKNSKTTDYKIEKLFLSENELDNIDFYFRINNGLYQGRGELGALKLLESQSGYPINADLSIMGIKLKTDAKLFEIFDNIRFDVKMKATEFLGNKYGEYIQADIKGGTDKIRVDIDSLILDGNEIKGEVNAVIAGEIPFIGAKLSASQIDISSFAEKKSAQLSLIKSAQATTLVPDLIIPYHVLYSVRVNAEVNIAKVLKNKNELAKNLVLNAQLNDGFATFDVLRGELADGTVRLNAKLSAADKSLLMNADCNKLNLKKLAEILNVTSDSFDIKSGSLFDVYINLIGTGDTYAQVIDSLSGQTVLLLNESNIHLGNVGLIKGNIFSQLFNTLNLSKGNDDLDLKCAVVRADFEDGKVDFPDGIVVNADKFTVVANGGINLKKDKIDISIKPFAGKLTDTNIAKALSSLVKLTGTLQKPKIGVDSVNAIKTIVGVTTAGPVYLGAQMLLENDGAPCYTALQGTKFENRFPKPKNVVNDTKEDVDKIFDNSVGAVRNTTKELLNIFSGGNNKKK